MAHSHSATAMQPQAIEHSPTRSSVRVAGITGQAIDALWSQAGPLIAMALEDYGAGEMDMLDVHQAIKARDMQLWMVMAEVPIAAAVTEVINYPRCKKVRIVLLGGKRLPEWVDDLEATFEAWAKSLGATGLEISGRAGWSKMLNRFGYREIHRVLHKEL